MQHYRSKTIEETIQGYFESTFQANATQIKRAFHPDATLNTIKKS